MNSRLHAIEADAAQPGKILLRSECSDQGAAGNLRLGEDLGGPALDGGMRLKARYRHSAGERSLLCHHVALG